MSDRTSNVALYWDFENIQASLVEKRGGREAYGRTKYQHQEVLIDVDSVVEYAATFGVVSINRAYCNWQWYGKYRESLLRNGLELIQLFHPGASAKNGGDIKLALDCTEDLLRFPHVDVVVIVGGDSDYLPLAQKIKALGKTLVGIGTQANTNRHWARSCHEFKFYEALILDEVQAAPTASAPTGPAPAVPAAPAASEAHADNVVTTPPEELLRRAILRLSGKGGDSWVLKGSIRPMMKRMDPTFDEEQHGARSFGAFIRKFEHLLEVRAGRNDQEIRLRGATAGAETSAERERPRERRREEPADRTPGRVAERIAQALERTSAEEVEARQNPSIDPGAEAPVQEVVPASDPIAEQEDRESPEAAGVEASVEGTSVPERRARKRGRGRSSSPSAAKPSAPAGEGATKPAAARKPSRSRPPKA